MYHQKSFNSNSSRQCSLLPVELFKASEEYYIFDANHVNFLEVNEVIFKVISILKHAPKDFHKLVAALPEHSARDIRDALSEIEEFQSQGYFKPHGFQRDNPYTLPDIKKNLNGNLEGLLLNITSKCNLSCSYCIFGGDYVNHSALQQQEMTWEIARKAIDFFLLQARKDGPFRVDFFGGEPLLSFPLIKRIVNNIKEKFLQRNQELLFAITSNGTVMNDKIADFLIEHDIILQISIDGNKELQNSNRKFKRSNAGSFDTILKNLQLIFDRDVDYFSNNVNLKAVLTTESLDTDETDFFKIPLINTLDKKKRFSMVNKSPHYDLRKDQDFFARIHKLGKLLLQKRDVANIIELLNGFDSKKKSLFFMTFYCFFEIQVVNYLYFDINHPVPFKKDCMIGIEGSVNADGSISICYKADTFVIGNVVENTWYFDKIAEYHKKRYSLTKCEYCFVKRFCNLCYEKMHGKEDHIKVQIRNFCEFTRYYYRLIFGYMLKIMEKNPKLWDELQKMTEEEKEKLIRKQSEVKATSKPGKPGIKTGARINV